MNIIIVEDEPFCCRHLEECLQNWGKKHSICINIVCYKTGKELFYSDYGKYHLIFLDIELPGITGMETAQNLRESNYKGQIIFLTAHTEYVFEGYHVRALDYIMKPILPEKLENCLLPVLNELESSSYILRTSISIEKISYSDIIAFSDDKYVH